MTSPTRSPARVRVLMIGPFPRLPDRIDGGVTAATMYLAQGLVADPSIDLIGVRICNDDIGPAEDRNLGWPTVDLALGSGSLVTLYRRQERRFLEILRHYKPDLIHAQGADLAGLLATGCGLPAVVTVHGLLGECARLQTKTLTKARAVLAGLLTERRTIRRAAHLISISPYIGEYYQGEIKGCVHDIPNAVAPRFFSIPRSPETGRVLFAGRISKGKGVHDLIQAVAQVPRKVEHLLLAGATPDLAYESFLRAEVERLGLTRRVSFAGLLDEPALLAEFARAGALVLPSYQETAPMVVQQAMAAGLPVVATRVGGIPQQIEHNVSGLLFEPGDVGALAHRLGLIHDEPELASRLAAAGKATAESRYQSSSVATATMNVYQEIIGAPRVGGVAGCTV
jgi:glycosyltransferase involved in cell wall biosynthesis